MEREREREGQDEGGNERGATIESPKLELTPSRDWRRQGDCHVRNAASIRRYIIVYVSSMSRRR